MAEPPTIISCNAPYASGGLGRHFSDLVEQTRLRGELLAYYSARIKQGDERIGHVVRDSIAPLLFRFTPIRFSPARKAFLSVDRFDKLVAKRLKGPFDCFIGFRAQSLATFKRPRFLGC